MKEERNGVFWRSVLKYYIRVKNYWSSFEDRPDLSSERAPHGDNTATFRQNITSGHGF
jgi:hypothetical protein